jgi:hypothetical protein
MLYDKAHLRDKNVAFKLKGSGVYFGVVKYVEDDGFWISAPDLILELQNDKAWGRPLAKMETQTPILFVPTTSLDYLIASEE